MPSEGITRFEARDASPRLLAALSGGLVGFIVLLGLALHLAYPQAARDRGERSEAPVRPEPRLQESPTEDLVAFRHREQERLSSYGWVDRRAGTVRMPIDEALAVTVKRGLPGWTMAEP